MSTLGKRLRRLRRWKEMTQNDVGRALGISRDTYANWETDRTSPDPDTLLQLARLFNTSVDYLVGRVDDPNLPESLGGDSNREHPANNSLPDWLKKLPPEMQEFVKEESQHGWPYLRLARGLKMQDLAKEELEAIVETWMDAKRRHEREFGK